MAITKTKLDERQIEDAVKEITKLKNEKNISWNFIFKHCPSAGSSSASALSKAVSNRSMIVSYEDILEFLRCAKFQDQGHRIDKLVREERAEAIAKRKSELNITYDEMYRFYEGHGKIHKSTFTDQIRRGYGGYTVGLIEWLNELTPEGLAELRKPSEEEAEKYKKNLKENEKYISEINEIKEKNGLSWKFLFDNTANGCKNKYALKTAIETASGTDFKTVLNDLKKIDFEKIKETKKKKKSKSKAHKNRYGRPYEGRRLVRVYAKENGVFGLQREYLE